MSCRDFERWSVADDPAERERAATHAASCPRCAAILAGQSELAAAVDAWREAAPEPPAELAARVWRSLAARAAAAAAAVDAGAVAEHRRAAGSTAELAPRAPRHSARPRPRLRRWAAALAASLVLAVGAALLRLLGPAGPGSSFGHLLASQALAEAADAERAHARAIARLEQAAGPLLARATDPTLPNREAARLLASRDRLRSLDRAIAEVETFLAVNPYHARARTQLLACYMDKTELLRDLLAQQPAPGGSS